MRVLPLKPSCPRLKKIDFLKKAGQAGYRSSLYFVATQDPDINVARVRYRVQTSSHTVAEEKIRSLYGHLLALLSQAVSFADWAYIFDNSGPERLWVADLNDGEIDIKTDQMPTCFKIALWDQTEYRD